MKLSFRPWPCTTPFLRRLTTAVPVVIAGAVLFAADASAATVSVSISPAAAAPGTTVEIRVQTSATSGTATCSPLGPGGLPLKQVAPGVLAFSNPVVEGAAVGSQTCTVTLSNGDTGSATLMVLPTGRGAATGDGAMAAGPNGTMIEIGAGLLVLIAVTGVGLHLRRRGGASSF
jgi:hypothetical protein